MDIPRTPKWKRIGRKLALGFSAGLAAVLVTGFVVQHFRDADFRANHPASGSTVRVAGHQIHFRQSGGGGVTFVLEAGLGDYSGSWGTLESDLGKIGRVFVYDRAGLGWSEESPEPRTAQNIAAELHQVLHQAQIPKPYILVGHSLGGVSQIRYALDYSDGVAGLLLIDPSHMDQFKRLPAPPAVFTYVLPQITRAAPFGLPQLLFRSPDPVQNLSRHVENSGAELRAFLQIAGTGGGPLRIGNIPISVLTAGSDRGLPGKTDAERKNAWETLKAMQDEYVAASSSDFRRHVVVNGASHYIHRTHPAAVTGAATELAEYINSHRN